MTDLRVNFKEKNSIARSLSFGFAKSSSDDKLIDSFKSSWQIAILNMYSPVLNKPWVILAKLQDWTFKLQMQVCNHWPLNWRRGTNYEVRGERAVVSSSYNGQWQWATVTERSVTTDIVTQIKCTEWDPRRNPTRQTSRSPAYDNIVIDSRSFSLRSCFSFLAA